MSTITSSTQAGQDYTNLAHMAGMAVAPAPSQLEGREVTLCVGDANIPLFDLEEILNSSGEERTRRVKEFGEGLRLTGFVAIKAEELTPLIDKVTEQTDKYFSQPEENKLRDVHGNNHQTGYTPPFVEKAAAEKDADNKATYFIAPNYTRWPDLGNSEANEEFKSVMQQYQSCMTLSAQRCMGVVAEYLGVPTEPFTTSIASAHNLLRLAYYPATNSNAPRAGAHTDLNCLTLLPPAKESKDVKPGLQLRDKEGNWRSVSAPKGCLIVNTADQLEQLTGGFIEATPHRVVKPDGQADKRIASIFFASLDTTFSLKPVPSCLDSQTAGMSDEERARYSKLYPDVTVGDNLASRLIEIRLYQNPPREVVEDLLAKGLLRQPPEELKTAFPDLFPSA